MRITCPHCGTRDLCEFSYGGDASRKFPGLDCTDMDRWNDYVFLRDNPRGRHAEYWQHIHGCRRWLVVERDTATHEIHSVNDAAAATTNVAEDGNE